MNADEELTARVAGIRLTQYGERGKPYETGTEKALYKISLALLAEIHRLRAPRADRDARLLREAAEVLAAECAGRGWHYPCNCRAVEVLRGMADEAGKVTPTGGEITQPAELTIYRASHESIVMGLYTTRQAAYEHCEAHELCDDPVSPMSWNVDEDGVAELARMRVPGLEVSTGYVVTPLTVASEYDEEADE